jgi:Mrp family chromosome partitioning ATPase
MFRIITEAATDYPNGGPAVVAIADAEPFVNGGAPFIEVGGPNGPVHSLPKSSPQAVTSADAPKPSPPSRPQTEQPYLSIALRPVAPRSGPRPDAISPDLVAYHHPDHPVSGEYRALAAEVRRQLGDGGPKAVLFTAAGAGSGTTTVLLNLAATLAGEPDARVLVVDADFHRPGAARKLGRSDTPGLAEVLAESMPLAWALQPTAVDRLQVLGNGKAVDDTATAFAAGFPALAGQLRQWFDWVLIDGGEWGEPSVLGTTCPGFDGVYVVTREGDLDRPAVAALRADVAKCGGLLRGFVTTRA